MKKPLSTLCAILITALLSTGTYPGNALSAQSQAPKAITLKTMGSLFFGGAVEKADNGDTFHGDHGYAQYYIPQNARQYPLIMWHGMGQSGRSWESTPDGREGFQAILTRHDWPVYIIDQPRRGRAGYTKVPADDPGAVPTTAREGGVWSAFRNGEWEPGQNASLNPNGQFPADPASIEQFFRQQTPNTGEEPRTNEHRAFMGKTMSALLDQTGPSVLITHSNSGQYGWFTAMSAPDKVKAVVAYEPGQLAFPEGERLADVPFRNELAGERLQPIFVSPEEFRQLTKMPIHVIYGDNISSELSDIFNVEVWRMSLARARQFVDTVNKYGGDATLSVLPEIGIKGNTHAPFADLNNQEIAAHLENWLQTKGLDASTQPHLGPQRKSASLTIPLTR
ncbi:alpha/beta fold hydrolase [Desulfovibrio sp. OttesenSCG-928-G15]|nr:alpha/beta fold hydrolase [Desulfovibrio sp. OttesenSCG-928-G15]